MPNPDFWAAYFVLGAVVWCAVSRYLIRWPVWGFEGIAIVALWPVYAALLGFELCKAVCAAVLKRRGYRPKRTGRCV